MKKAVPLKDVKSRPGALPSKCGSTLNMAANIKVVVRVRPLNEKERGANSRVVVDVVDDTMLVFDPKEELRPFFYQGVQQPTKNVLRRANKELKFVFDNVCGQTASNKDIFELTTKDVLASLMEGYNCSVFVYGATGAGKTFTMIGSKENPGITYLTMEHLFYTINSFEKERDFDIGVSYIEVYNENVYDLLKPSKTPLQLREDAKYGVMVAGLTLESINTARELLNMLENGNKNRTQHPTDANAESSRSHAVFQMRYKTSSQARVVKLSMIDLAGSERASATGCVGERFKEGANINRSLLDSKLTRLLKDSLGGNCKTVMIANISPSSISYEDTYNTLKYAARANKIQLSVKKNIVDAKADWRCRITEEEKLHITLESHLFGLRTRSKVLALRQRLQIRAFTHVAELAHRSSNETMELMVTEDIPRQERAAESYEKKARHLESKILLAHSNCEESWMQLQITLKQALSDCPDLQDFIDKVVLQRELRHTQASDNLRNKLLWIQNKEINMFTEYMSEMPNMLRKLYLTLKGYDKVPPALATEYVDLMKKAKSMKSISWDMENECNDPHFKLISSINSNEMFVSNGDAASKLNTTVDIVTDSDDLTDIENREVSPKKRKGTPIKLPNNETIVIDDSFENLDATRTLNSTKKVKREADVVDDVENAGSGMINPKDLNSTFVLAGKMEAMRRPKLENVKVELNFKSEPQAVKRGLTDRTNTIQRTINFNDKAKVVKPVVGKALPQRRPPVPRAPGFGSSLSRDGTPLARTVQAGRAMTEKVVGYKAVRTRERVATHPYSRPNAFNKR
ncbi:hypothetical protein MSG28_007420 [Choristoneura fumiferana]|uniref:Uncharacterized protein n=2 Tax=Choristoneura fumiferana TaxID=7141 RepID=A0ACC0JX39_CHOFU|nr:hypothetical protein MSG28_007420 [Choristoneura fumiferana]KAI8428723.1 hypothetical protein MSG28_007420 [Choristoneura fumiferana]